jgi:hypothetical protein
MSMRRSTLALLFGVAATTLATAQSPGAWRRPDAADGYYGLQLARSTSAARCAGIANPCAVNIPLLEKATAGIDWRLTGRLGAPIARPTLAAMGASSLDTGLSYGVGLSWDLSPTTSATVGFDSYDYRFVGGERDAVRATSLGLQWRY